MTNDITIRPLQAEDFNDWRELFIGYCNFYKMPATEQKIANVWGWLMNPNHVFEGYGAVYNGKLVGLCHLRAQPRPLSGEEIGYWEDMYVNPEYRGLKIAHKIVEFVRQLAKQRGWALVRWLTADTNYTARKIYDQYAEKTAFALYQMKID